MGHWELAGVITERPFPTYPDGFPQELLDAFAAATGRGVIGNVAASGTEIIERLGEEHQRTGKWIVYTSADSVFQIAAHEETVPLEELYAACRTARGLLTGEHAVGARDRPAVRGRARRLPPHAEPPRLLARAPAAELPLAHPRGRGARDGRRQDQRHLRRLRHRRLLSDAARTPTGSRARSRSRARAATGSSSSNLVETDMTYGHRNDPEGFHRCLQEIDAAIPDLRAALGPDDLLVLTSDHGCDPTTPSTDHSREYALLVAHVPGRGPAAATTASSRTWAPPRRRGSERATGDGLPGYADRPVRAVELIERKRDGGEHAPGEIAVADRGLRRRAASRPSR